MRRQKQTVRRLAGSSDKQSFLNPLHFQTPCSHATKKRRTFMQAKKCA